MPSDRRNLPPELRKALQAAERAERAAPRRGRWRRRLAMVLPGALVPSLLIVIGYLVWHQGGAPAPAPAAAPSPGAPAASPQPAAARPGTSAAMPRVVYGTTTPGQQEAGPPTRFTARAMAVDGDTLAVGNDRLRLNGIDAPEMGQVCERGGQGYDCGEAARAAMSRILGEGAVACEAIGTDRYGRRVVRCLAAGGQDIAAALVAQGWAMAYRQYSLDYIAQEDTARAVGRGMWAGRFEAPWDYRQRQR